MTPAEARERMLAALAAAGVNGLDTDDEDFPCVSAAEHGVLIRELRALRWSGIATEICSGVWRLSDQELARRILRAVGFEHAEREHVLIDAVAGILRGL